MMKSITEISTEELRAYTDFSRGLVVKESEIADMYESDVLRRLGNNYQNNARVARDWKQIVAYMVPHSELPVRTRQPYWYQVERNSPGAVYAIGNDRDIWRKFDTNSWYNIMTGESRFNQLPEWTLLTVPAGEIYIDPVKKTFLIPTIIWYDSVTDEFSMLGPSDGVFVEGEVQNRVWPDGLSDVIQTPQEYITTRLKLATGNYRPEELPGIQQAIASFEAPSRWEDRSEPVYLHTADGVLQLDASGFPLKNPKRVVMVAFRGELNDYYRRLVHKHNINPFDSRMAEQFEIITWDSAAGFLPATTQNRFVAIHSECVRVYKAAFYNEAFEGDEMYLKYCRLYIAWMSIMRMVNDKMKGVLDIDRMDSYELTNLLYSSGIYQFDDMPLIYKRRFAKSLERLLSRKGTTAVFKDILGIFNLDKEVTIWKHYLVKYFPEGERVLTLPRYPEADEGIDIWLSDETSLRAQTIEELCQKMVEVGGFRSAVSNGLTIRAKRHKDSPSEMVTTLTIIKWGTDEIAAYGEITEGSTDYGLPDIGFKRVDMDDPTAEIQVSTLETADLEDYDAFIGGDYTWETSKEEAKKMAFSTLQTKYFSIASAVDTVYNGMSLGFIWSMLKDAEARGRTGTMRLSGAPTLNGVESMNLFEGLVACLIITLWRFDVDDIIPHGESGVSQIIGTRTDGVPFPNEGSLIPYSTRLERVADEADPLIAQRVGEMNDTNIHLAMKVDRTTNDTVRYGVQGYDGRLGGEETRTVPTVHSMVRLWDHKFVSKYQTEAFGAVNTYSEWLGSSNPRLMNWLRMIDDRGEHVDALLTLISLIEDDMKSETLNLRSALGVDDVLLHYVERLIKFFKAYTTDLHEISVFMLIDRPATESLRLMNLLAGILVKMPPNFDGLDDLHDIVDLISKLGFDDGKASSLLTDLADRISSLEEQDIVRFLEYLPSWLVKDLRVNPAAVMQDRVTFNVYNEGQGDTLTMATRFQRSGDIIKTNPRDKVADISEYDSRRRWRTRVRHGLADGVIIVKPDTIQGNPNG